MICFNKHNYSIIYNTIEKNKVNCRFIFIFRSTIEGVILK